MTVLRKWLGSGLLFIFAAAAFAQSPISTQQVNIPISVGLPAPPIPLGSATVTGTQTPGNYFNATYYFWVVAEFTVGNSAPAGPIPCFNAPPTLSVSNYCSFSWNAVPGANSYDVLMTSNSAPPSGACNCAVTTATSSTSINVQSNSLSSYTVATFQPNNLGLSLTNESVGAGNSHLILRRQPSGAQLADLNAVASGLADPGANGVLKRTAPNTTAIATNADIVALINAASLQLSNPFFIDAARPYVDASSQGQSDWCANVNSADTLLGTQLGEIHLDPGAGTANCSTNITLSAQHTLRVMEGAASSAHSAYYYELGTHSVLLNSGSTVIASGDGGTSNNLNKVNFSYTGTGSAFESANQAVEIDGVRLEGFNIVGSGGGSKCLDTTGMGDSTFSKMMLENCSTELYSDETSVAGYYNVFDKVSFVAAAASSGYVGIDFRGAANAQRFYGARFSRLTRQFVIGTTGAPNEIDCYGCTFEQADTLSVEVTGGSSINFYGGRWENDPIAIQTDNAANNTILGVLADCPYIGTLTGSGNSGNPWNDNAGALTVRDCGYGRENSFGYGLNAGSNFNLFPDANFESFQTFSYGQVPGGWNQSAYVSCSGSPTTCTGNYNYTAASTAAPEGTIQCGNASQCLIHSGSTSVKVGSNTDGRGIITASTIPVDPNKVYTLSYWWTTDSTASSHELGTLMLLTNASGTPITNGIMARSYLDGDPPNGGFQRQDCTYNSAIYQAWLCAADVPTTASVLQRKTVLLKFPKGTSNGDTAFLQFGFVSENGGYAYVDDVCFAEGLGCSARPTPRRLGDSGTQNAYGTLSLNGNPLVPFSGTLINGNAPAYNSTLAAYVDSGTPPIKVLCSQSSYVDNTGNTTTNVVGSCDIPKGTIAATGRLHVHEWIDPCTAASTPGFPNITCSAANTGTCTVKATWNTAANFSGGSAVNLINSGLAAAVKGELQGDITNTASNAQILRATQFSTTVTQPGALFASLDTSSGASTDTFVVFGMTNSVSADHCAANWRVELWPQ